MTGRLGTETWFAQVLEGEDLRDLLRQRPRVEERLQSAFDAVFRDDGDLTAGERFAAAVTAAEASGDERLADAFRALAAQSPVPLDARLTAILAFARIVASDPASTDAQHYAQLRAEGLSEPALVTLTLLVGYVSFLVRAHAGLAAIGGAADER